MEQAAQIAALCVTGAVLSLLIRQGNGVMGWLLALGTAAAAGLYLWPTVRETLELIGMLGDRSGLSAALLKPLYKTVGIALVTRLGSDLCRDAGESALGATVEAAGSVCALLCAFPLLWEVMEMLLEMMA